MYESRTPSDRRFQFLEDLAEGQAVIDNDVSEIDEDSWLIHGVIPYGREVPMAVFDTQDNAEQALDMVRAGRG